MDEKILLQRNARVVSADGRHVGTLERVVVYPENNVLTDIVIRTGGLLKTEEKVVPINLVAGTTTDYILLDDSAGELKSFPRLEEERLVDEEGSLNPPADPERRIRHTLSGNPFMGTPILPVVPQQVLTRMEMNIPEGSVALKEGAKVYASEGDHVGIVERILADSEEETITHLVVARGLFLRETKLVPIRWVMNLDEDSVHLRVRRNSIDALKDLPLAG